MSLTLTARVEGAERIQARLEAISGRRLEEAAQRGIMRGLRQIARSAKERAPYRSGKGRRAIFAEPLAGELGGRVVVPPIDGVPYMLWQHEGTGVYGATGQPITPIGHQFLHFFTRGDLYAMPSGRFKRRGGQEVFTRQVLGVKPNPFFRDAIEVALGLGLVQHEIVGSLAQAARLEADVREEDGSDAD